MSESDFENEIIIIMAQIEQLFEIEHALSMAGRLTESNKGEEDEF